MATKKVSQLTEILAAALGTGAMIEVSDLLATPKSRKLNIKLIVVELVNVRADLTAHIAAAVTSVAGRAGAVVLTHSDISGLGTMAVESASDYVLAAGSVVSVAGRAGAVTLSNTDISGLGTMATASTATYATTAALSTTNGNVTTLSNDLSTLSGNFTTLSDDLSNLIGSLGTMSTESTSNWVSGSYFTAFQASLGNMSQETKTDYMKVADAVVSVAGRAGAVTLTHSDIGGLGTMAVETATNYATTAALSSAINQMLAITGGLMDGGIGFTGPTFAGFQLNRMTETQRDALSAPARPGGSMIWNTTAHRAEVYNDFTSTWDPMS